MNKFTWMATGYVILGILVLLMVAALSMLIGISGDNVGFLPNLFMASDLITLAFCSALFLILINDAQRDRSAFLFFLMVVELFAITFIVMLQITMVTKHYYENLILLSEYVANFLSLLINFTLWYYVWLATDKRGPALNYFRHFVNVIFVAGIVYLFLNLHFHHLFLIGPMGSIVYPAGYLGPVILPVIMSFITLITILLFVSTTRKMGALSVYIVIPFGTLMLGYVIGGNGFTYFAFLLAMMTDYSNIYVKRRQELKKKEAKLMQQRADILISQVQPHFLYNALTSIMNIKGNPMATRDAIADFGKYLRGNLDTLKQRGPIPIMIEMDHVESFSELVKLNSGEDLQVVVDMRDRNFLIPSLTVQTVLEYIIQFGYGVKHMEGRIDIMVFESEDAHNVVIRDDHGLVRRCFDVSNGSMSTLGLSAVEKRMADMVGGTIAFNSMDDNIVATIAVPKKTVRKAAANPAA